MRWRECQKLCVWAAMVGQLFSAHLAAQPKRLAVVRERLGSLGWYMRYLKQSIARQVNKQYGCRGHFWESRYRSQALLDDPAVLACMVYVDLNPVRADVVEMAEQSAHTSVRHRVGVRW